MKTLLRIDASVRINGSNTCALTDYFQARWQKANPEGDVIRRCLASDPIPHLSNEMIEAFQQASGPSQRTSLSDTLIDELRRADHVLVGSPLYNLTLPSTLKAYFDHVVRSGATFEVRRGNYRGLLNGRSASTRARLIAVVSCFWCRAQVPDTRRGTIFPRSVTKRPNRFSSF